MQVSVEGKTQVGYEPKQHTFSHVHKRRSSSSSYSDILQLNFLTEYHVSPSSLREIYACSLLRSSSLLSFFLTSVSLLLLLLLLLLLFLFLLLLLFFSFSSIFFLSVHTCTHTQISSDALSADYSLFIKRKKRISYDKLWYNVFFCHFVVNPLYK